MNLSKKLARRTFLRGLGTSIALPFLEAMIPASAATSALKSPCRMAFLYVPNGIIMEAWTPQTEGPVAELPRTLPRVLEPLAPYRDNLLLLSGLSLKNGDALGDGPGDHARAGASYLTAAHPKKTFGADIQVGVSVDQIAAQKIAGQTQFASLELSCEDGLLGGNCDNGYSCAYSNSISWRTPSTPMPAEISPRALFERLFGGADASETPQRRARQRLYEKSILDFVLEDTQRLKGTLGPTDRRKMDEYLYAVRDIEKRIERAERNNRQALPTVVQPPSGIPESFKEHSELMFDLLAVAFQADLTRIATLMLGLEQSTRSYPEIGISEAHHGLTHHLGNKEKIEKVTQINCFHARQFAYFLGKLNSIKDGDGTLLDHSMIVYGSGLSDGNRHLHHNLPVLMAGRGCGTVRPGRHVIYPQDTPMANLYVAMLDRMGVQIESMADSNGELGYLEGI